MGKAAFDSKASLFTCSWVLLASRPPPRLANGSVMEGWTSRKRPKVDGERGGERSSSPDMGPSENAARTFSAFKQTNKPASFLTPPSTSIKFGGGMGGKFDPSKYLAKMGWTGGGLGKQGEGIVNPIEVKQRPERAGIAFGGIKEKTKQAKEEARRRGEDVSTDEEERDKRKRNQTKKVRTKAKVESGPQVWTRQEEKPRKPKIEHRTYEEILEEHGHLATTSAGIGQIFDAAGNEFSSMSAALAKHAVPSNESTQLVEVRHNLHLICLTNQKELQALAKEGANIQERHKWLLRERDESQRRVQKEEAEASRLNGVLDLVRHIELVGRQSEASPKIALSSFDDPVEQIITRYRDVISEFHLDEAIVGAIVPLLRRQWAQWQPLQEPKLGTNHFTKWKDALRIGVHSNVMTPYESLIWNLWMPPVRSAINNEWDPYEASAAVTLYQAWQPLLPSFILDNLTQQLILPKLNSAVVEWDAKKPLHRMLFPWMSLLGQQMDDVVSEAKRRVRSSLKSWKVQTGVPEHLLAWKEAKVFSSKEWNSMLLDHVVPKLSSYLEAQLVINPQAQAIKSLEVLLSWKRLLASKILSKVLQAKFVTRWLHTLHSWLIEPQANLEEVAKWYEYWKAWFTKQDVMHLSSLQEAFQVALKLMSRAMEMGQDRRRLPLPDLKQTHAAANLPMKAATIGNVDVRAPLASTQEDTASTFRQIVEESMMEADLIMQSLNRKEMRSGMPLYRVSRHLDGKGGVTLYLEEDVIFVEKRGENATTTYEPVSLRDLVKLAA